MPVIYDSCEELPLYNYIRCLVHDDLSHLLEVRDKSVAFAHQDELRAAWVKIQDEYMDLMQGSMNLYAAATYFELEQLKIKQLVVMAAVDLANNYMLQGFVDILTEYGYDLPFDVNNPEECKKLLQRTLKRAKRIELDIKEAESKLESAKGDEVKINVAFFDKILNSLSKFMGSHVDERVMTVSRYAACLNAYNEYVEQLKSNQNGGTGEA